MIAINPLDVFLWTIRRNEKDVVNLYHSLSPIMQQATGGSMLNFGYWNQDVSDPISAQENLCSYFGNLAELKTAKKAADVGSGLSAPSIFWTNKYEKLNLFCVNINLQQLQYSGAQKNIEFVNSSATILPFSDNSLDRILALESAQHFKPLSSFVKESHRVLTDSGIFALAIPVTFDKPSISNLGILQFTWSSEHYSSEYVRKIIKEHGFQIMEEKFIGKNVYEPLAEYYVKNRTSIKSSILKKYPKYVEVILYNSIKKMKQASEKQVIDYFVLKCMKSKAGK